MSINWDQAETVDVPRGAYVSWGTKTGQHVTGRVLDYSLDGGTDFAGNKCPTIAVELTEKAASINKDGDRTNFDPGEIVQLNAGQVSLKRALRAANPATGDLIKITLENLVKTANGTVKEYDIKIIRNPHPNNDTANPAPDDDEPPF